MLHNKPKWYFERLGVGRNRKKDEPLEDNPGIKFNHDVMMSEPFNEKEEHIDSLIHEIFKDRMDKLDEEGVGVHGIVEEYFPNIWNEKSLAKAFIAKSPLKGSEHFRKKKHYRDVYEGIKAGLTPVSNDPIDIVLLKLGEIDKALFGHRVISELRGMGYVKFVKLNTTAPHGWSVIPDKLGEVWATGFQGNKTLVGHFYGNRAVQTFLETTCRNRCTTAIW